MNARQLLLMESIDNASTALKEPEFQTATIIPLRRRLDAIMVTLRQHLSVQTSAAGQLRGDRGSVMNLKAVLRKKHLLPIARRGKLVLRGYPGIAESLRVPHARADAKTHAAAARRLVKAIRPHSAMLVAEGFSKTFLSDCLRAVKALEDRQANPDTQRNRLARATRSIPDALREGRLIISTIDSHVQAELGDDELAAGRWKSGKRVPRKKGRPRKGRATRTNSEN